MAITNKVTNEYLINKIKTLRGDDYVDSYIKYEAPITNPESIRSQLWSINKKVKDHDRTIKWNNGLLSALIIVVVLTFVWRVLDSWWRLPEMKEKLYEDRVMYMETIDNQNKEIQGLRETIHILSHDISNMERTINAQINQKLIDHWLLK